MKTRLACFVPLVMCALCCLGRTDKLSFRDQPFDANWRFFRGDAGGAEQPGFDDSQWRALYLPHDWSIEDLPPKTPSTIGPFDPMQSDGGHATGYTVGGVGWYRKHFTMVTNKAVTIRFDGVYMNCSTWINGRHLGTHPYGYTPFVFDLTPYLKPAGEENIIAVQVRNLGYNSRWYSGSGLYRHVWLSQSESVRVPDWGVRVLTPSITASNATIDVMTTLTNASDTEIVTRLRTRLIGPDGKIAASQETEARSRSGSQQEFTQVINLDKPDLWSPKSPVLYRAEVEVLREGNMIDALAVPFGIRTVQINATKGLLINGEPVKLKGGCMHCDNGPLGAVAIDRAEERRVELTKAAGFNAIRTSHNPPSPAFLDACDRLGMLVIDEAFDVWQMAKHPDDYHLFFAEWWKRDLQAMLVRDRNHPCVILWSIGNEVPEQSDPSGAAISQEMAQYVRKFDSTRLVTLAVNDFAPDSTRTWTNLTPPFPANGVAGYNYLWQQYAPDHIRFPWRVIVGTESTPMEAYDSWKAVENSPWVLGDFLWTAWDYLGESGLAHSSLDNERQFWYMPFPWHNAWCGDIDICGFAKPQHFYREVLWGQTNLSLSVHFPLAEERREQISRWGWPDERKSWTWPGWEGKKIYVFVYSSCEAVRLELNGKEVAFKPMPKNGALTAYFLLPYEPGELKAVGLTGGKPMATATLTTAGAPKKLRLTPDRASIRADRNDLSYVTVEAVDDHDRVSPIASIPVRFSVSGAGELAAVGNGSPVDTASFQKPERLTFQGRCLAILRPKGGAGEIKLRAEADGLEPAEITVKTRSAQ